MMSFPTKGKLKPSTVCLQKYENCSTNHEQEKLLIFLGQNVAFSQTIFSEAFSWMKKFLYFDSNVIEVCS